MPIFDYHCARCRNDFELLVVGSTIPTCPTCGSRRLQKQVALTAPQGKSKQIIASARRAAAREGHLSNFSPSERRLPR